MVKIKRDKRFVWPDRYYIWTYYPKKYRKSIGRISKDKLYAKHFTCFPYFSRQHAKHVACFYHGKVALKYIHIVSGKRLLHWGWSTFNKESKSRQQACFIKGQVRYLRHWAYPPEYRYDKHRRRYYIVRLNRAFKQGGKKKFNQTYWELNYGSNYRRYSRSFMRRNYRQAEYAILSQIQEAEYQGEK